MALNATTFLNNFNTKNYIVTFCQNARYKFSHNNSELLLLKNGIKAIRDNFTAVNSFYLKENYIEYGNTTLSSDAKRIKNETAWLADMRLELLRKVMVKRSVREKLILWQKKKNEMLRNAKCDNLPKPATFQRELILVEKPNYKLILDEIEKRKDAERVSINRQHEQRGIEIRFKGLLAKSVLTVSIIDGYLDDFSKIALNIGEQINGYCLMKSKLDFLRGAEVVDETTLIAVKNLSDDLVLYKNNVIMPIQNKLQTVTSKTNGEKNLLEYFSVNVPEKKTLEQVRRRYVSLIKNNENLVSCAHNVEKLSFANDPTTKIFRQNLIKIINTIVNTISSINETHLTDKYNKLNELLNGKLVSVSNTQVIIGTNKDALAFCMDTLATKMINYAEQVICVKSEIAFEMAIIIVKLWSVHQQFGKIFLAKIKQKCPLLVPFSLPVAKCLTSEQKLNYNSLGYKFDSSGNIESHDKYLKRMIGIVRLYSAVIVTSSKYEQPVIGISQAWIFVAGTLNQYPVADITSTMLVEFLTIAGFAMHQNYGIQFIKLLQYINTHYMKKIVLVTPAGLGGPVSRLNNFLLETLFNGSIKEPKGMLSFNYL